MSNLALSDKERETLAALANAVIPDSKKFNVPGAGDPAIVAEIENDAERQMPDISKYLNEVENLAENFGAPFSHLNLTERLSVVEAFRSNHPVAAGKFGNIVVQCYYRDDRVMTSLGMELRAPHPKGYEVATGDWSLLEPVRRRQSFYRPTD
jgi:hypothetical protein